MSRTAAGGCLLRLIDSHLTKADLEEQAAGATDRQVSFDSHEANTFQALPSVRLLSPSLTGDDIPHDPMEKELWLS